MGAEMGFIDFWMRTLCCQPLTFPAEGRLPWERPHPSRPLLRRLGWSVRALTLQLIFSLALSVISFSARVVAVGMFLNPVQVIAELITLFGAYQLSFVIYLMGLGLTLACRLAFLLFIILNFVGSLRADDPMAWVVIALFLPGTIFMLILFACTVPLLFTLMKRDPPDGQARPATVVASTAPTQVAIGVPVP